MRRTYATSVPGRCSGSLVGHYEPARSDHRRRHKSQDVRVGAPQGAGRDASRPGPGDPGPPGSHALSGRSGEIQAMRLVARHPPRMLGRRKKRMRATPWPRAETGADIHLPQRNAQSRRWGNGPALPSKPLARYGAFWWRASLAACLAARRSSLKLMGVKATESDVSAPSIIEGRP